MSQNISDYKFTITPELTEVIQNTIKLMIAMDKPSMVLPQPYHKLKLFVGKNSKAILTVEVPNPDNKEFPVIVSLIPNE